MSPLPYLTEHPLQIVCGVLRIGVHCRKRVHDAEQHMTQLQTDLHALQQQHQFKVAQMGKDKESLLANIQALTDQSSQLQVKLNMQRCASNAMSFSIQYLIPSCTCILNCV